MTQKSSKTEANESKKPLVAQKLSIPMGASIDDIMRALRILSDVGGQARKSEIETSFGTKPSEKNLLSWALSGAVAFDLIEPHKRRTPYVISADGKKFLSLTEDEQQAMLLPKFLRVAGYRKVLVTMKNNQDRSLKKQTITDIWLQIRDRVKLGTRQYYTMTFASVGTWCGALTDTGQTCSITPQGEQVLNEILKGEKTEKLTKPPSGPVKPTTPLTTPTTSALITSHCPYCSKSEIGIESEELLDTLSSNGTHILIIKTTHYCRGCSRVFSLIGQRSVGTSD